MSLSDGGSGVVVHEVARPATKSAVIGKAGFNAAH
jgi:2-C-methyl-D-erythritol 4-phosphate cytidylyltransferase